MMKAAVCKYVLVLVGLCLSSRLFAQDQQIVVPLGGNAWVHGGSAKITEAGLVEWKDASSITNAYFYSRQTGYFKLTLRLKVSLAAKSSIAVTVNGQKRVREVKNATLQDIDFGNFSITKQGYVKVQIQGIDKTGAEYAEVSDLVLIHIPADKIAYVKNNDDNYFHWGRRGPSVHLNYQLPAEIKNNIEWFYTEITVPNGMDKIGSYFMANGFSFGYFGMQVNSATERRVLFSVWSPQTTDDPKAIADSMRVQLLRKGAKVHGGEFGNEGAGGQSYLQYQWKAGQTYAFLLHASPDSAQRTTTFTAYFKEKSDKSWQLLASFKRPQTITYLNHLYSFLENFEPETGEQERMAWYHHQWVADGHGKWYPIQQILFTGDNTARKGYRLDYAGGADSNNGFYLRNCGFFDDAVPLNQTFNISTNTTKPQIQLNQLP